MLSETWSHRDLPAKAGPTPLSSSRTPHTSASICGSDKLHSFHFCMNYSATALSSDMLPFSVDRVFVVFWRWILEGVIGSTRRVLRFTAKQKHQELLNVFKYHFRCHDCLNHTTQLKWVTGLSRTGQLGLTSYELGSGDAEGEQMFSALHWTINTYWSIRNQLYKAAIQKTKLWSYSDTVWPLDMRLGVLLGYEYYYYYEKK